MLRRILLSHKHPVKTFRERYCAARHYRDDEFVPRVFWHCLYRQAVPFAALILLVNTDYFAADRDLITFAGRATNLKQFNEEVRDFVKDRRNRGLWRSTFRMRVSAHRLRNLVVAHLGEAAEQSTGSRAPGPAPASG